MPQCAVETVYTGRDNTIDLLLTENGRSIQDYTAITRAVMMFDSIIVDSDIDSTVFDWSGSKLTAKLGFSGIPAKEYFVKVETWDPGNPNGIVWTDALRIIVQ